MPRPSSSSGPARSRLPSRRRLVVPSGAVVVVVGRSGAESRRRDSVVRGSSVPSRFRLQVPRATGGACRGSSPVPRYTTRRLRPSISPRLSQLSQFGGHGMPRRPVASSCSSSSRSGSCRSSSSSGGTCRPSTRRGRGSSRVRGGATRRARRRTTNEPSGASRAARATNIGPKITLWEASCPS